MTNVQTKSVKRSSFDIQSEAINILNEYCTELVNHFTTHLPDIIGKKCFLADGSKSKEFKSIPDYEKQDYKEPKVKFISYQYWFDFSHNTVKLHGKICLHGGSYDDNTYYCVYNEQTIWLGELNGQVLTSVSPANKVIDDYGLNKRYTPEQLSELVNEYKSLHTQARNAFHAIPDLVRKESFISF